MNLNLNRTRRNRLIVLLIIAIPSWFFTDMDSMSRFYAYVLPLLTFICVLFFCLWIVDVFAHIDKRNNSG
jgi:hypothetical protein